VDPSCRPTPQARPSLIPWPKQCWPPWRALRGARHPPSTHRQRLRQGIVHVIARSVSPQPGMTVACGDSHTFTHGAFENRLRHRPPARCVDCAGGPEPFDRQTQGGVAIWVAPAAFWCVRQGLDPPHDSPARGQRWRGYAYELLVGHRSPSMEETHDPLQQWRLRVRVAANGHPECHTTFAYLHAGGGLGSRANWERRWLVQSLASGARATSTTRCVRCSALAPTALVDHPPAKGIGIDEAVRPPTQLEPTSAPWPSSFTSTWDSPGACDGRSICGVCFHRQLHQRSAVICAPLPAVPGGERWPAESQAFVVLALSRWPAPPLKPRPRSGLPPARV